MENLTDRSARENSDGRIHGKNGRGGFFKNLHSIFTEVKQMAKRERVAIYDAILFSIGFLFARCHLFFGAYPLGVALVASLSFGVWSSLLGAVTGALTLGRQGIIFAIVTVITVFIRVIISGGDGAEERGKIFSENLLLRMCSSIIGGFITAVYELLLSGFSEASVLFGASMILLPPVIVFLLSGVFSGGFSVSALTTGNLNLLTLSGKGDRERYNIIFFEISSLTLLFLIAFSLGEADILGVSFSFVFLAFASLVVAKRFGALKALAAGFVASLGVGGVYSVSFGLLGLVSGGLFGFGIPYGIIGGGLAALLWGWYSSGLTGFLSVLPEYSIAAIVAFPILKKLSPEATVEENEREERSARDMIGTMALLYQKKYSENIDALERSFEDLSRIVRSGSVHGADYEDYKSAVFGVAEDFCKSCQGRDYCIAENVNPCVKNSEKITKKMLSGEAILPEDINLDDEFCQYPEEMATALTRAAAMVKRENYRRRELVDNESYGLVSRLIREARAQDEAEKAVNPYKSDQLSAVISEFGFGSGASRVFGDKRLHIFVAVEDDGEKISSKELKESIERGLDISLGTPEFFKKDSMILMECSEEPRFNVEYAMARRSARDGECSGDTLRFVETEGGMIYSLISDGMGQGKEAAETSLFVADFLEKMLEFSSSGDGVIHLLNRALRQRNSECSATVDLFGFDRYSKEATFLKSGAASSYVKRDGSIFRIRSKTAPLGILSAIDTEKIKVEVKEGDMIIMISDGICQGEDTKAWLVDLLSRPAPRTSAAYAELILKEAEKNEELLDDMSVAVLKIVKNG